MRSHVASRSSDELLRRLAESLQGEEIEHAAAALAGARQPRGFAGYGFEGIVQQLDLVSEPGAPYK